MRSSRSVRRAHTHTRRIKLFIITHTHTRTHTPHTHARAYETTNKPHPYLVEHWNVWTVNTESEQRAAAAAALRRHNCRSPPSGPPRLRVYNVRVCVWHAGGHYRYIAAAHNRCSVRTVAQHGSTPVGFPPFFRNNVIAIAVSAVTRLPPNTTVAWGAFTAGVQGKGINWVKPPPPWNPEKKFVISDLL